MYGCEHIYFKRTHFWRGNKIAAFDFVKPLLCLGNWFLVCLAFADCSFCARFLILCASYFITFFRAVSFNRLREKRLTQMAGDGVAERMFLFSSFLCEKMLLFFSYIWKQEIKQGIPINMRLNKCARCCLPQIINTISACWILLRPKHLILNKWCKREHIANERKKQQRRTKLKQHKQKL